MNLMVGYIVFCIYFFKSDFMEETKINKNPELYIFTSQNYQFPYVNRYSE